MSIRYIIFLVLVTFSLSCKKSPSLEKYPYKVHCDNGSGWSWMRTTTVADSFNMISKNKITIYRDSVKLNIIADRIWVSINDHYMK